ncbi:MAG: VanZ family protein [Candidatus Eisenbacteria bacterium]|nr:VanZ family protein [Candidatus Eisenbacteria bacterium]
MNPENVPAGPPPLLDRPMFTPGPRSAFRQVVFYWVPVLAYVSAIFYVSSLSSPPSPLTFEHADKLEHFAEYLLLGLLLGRALRQSVAPFSPVAAVVMTVALVMMVAAADEYYQMFVPGRECDVFDWLTDSSAGVVSQVMLWQLWFRLGRDRNRKVLA